METRPNLYVPTKMANQPTTQKLIPNKTPNHRRVSHTQAKPNQLILNPRGDPTRNPNRDASLPYQGVNNPKLIKRLNNIAPPPNKHSTTQINPQRKIPKHLNDRRTNTTKTIKLRFLINLNKPHLKQPPQMIRKPTNITPPTHSNRLHEIRIT